jgi:hypothetical protein
MTQTVSAISERAFQDNVIALAKLFGWRVAHFRPAQTKHGWRTPMQGDKGFPDLVLAKGGRVVFAELKSDKGKLSADQKDWIAALDAPPGWDSEMSHEVHVWYPDDLDAIGKILGPG